MNTILITGAGSGIGKATAQLLSTNPNNRLILIGRKLYKLKDVLNSLENKGNHLVHSIDVSKKKELITFLASSKADLDTHPLINIFSNAGIGGGNTWGYKDKWQEIIDINLTGAYNTCMASYPWLKKSLDKGIEIRNIAITSSCLARFGVPGMTAYISSKTAIMGLVRGLAIEWSRNGILINAIAPGWVDTDMARESIQGHADLLGKTYDEMYAETCSVVPTGRMSSPTEIAALVEFLFSGSQQSITGTTIDINNGSWMG